MLRVVRSPSEEKYPDYFYTIELHNYVIILFLVIVSGTAGTVYISTVSCVEVRNTWNESKLLERDTDWDSPPAGGPAWLEVAADWTGLKMSCSRYSPHSPPSALQTRPYLTQNSASCIPRNGFKELWLHMM